MSYKKKCSLLTSICQKAVSLLHNIIEKNEAEKQQRSKKIASCVAIAGTPREI